MDSKAFDRAWTFLDFSSGSKWTATLSAFGTGVLYVALLSVLALVIDLLVSGGRIPTAVELTARQVQLHDATWKSLSPEIRKKALAEFGASPEVEARVSNPDATLSLADRELRWQVAVWMTLSNRIGPDAATLYKSSVSPPDGVSPLLDREFGGLSLVARSQGSWAAPLMASCIAWMPWSWQPTLSSYVNTSYLTGLVLIAVLIALVRALLMYTMHNSAAKAVIDAGTRLRRGVYQHSYRIGMLTVRSHGPNEAVSAFTRHSEAVQDGMYAWLTVAPREPVKFVLLILFALMVNFWLGMTFLVLATILILLGNQIASTVRGQARSAGRRAANLLALLQESLMRMRLVKSYQMELFNQARVERQLSEFSQAQLLRTKSESFTRPVVVFLATAAGAFLLYIAGRVVLHGGVGVTTLIVMAAALVSLYEPLIDILAARRIVKRANESAAGLFEFLDRKGEVSTALGADFMSAMKQSLLFDDVSIRDATTGKAILENINIEIAAGSRVAIVGPNEAEKHALVYLIPRFLDPTSGEIRMDAQNVRWVTIDSLRMQISLVMQHNLVFNDTVANNIGCGDPRFTTPQIIEAAKLTHAHQFIQKLPHGYETNIGELGHTLKPGEQFRLALARAILRDPSILIIEEPIGTLDEDTNELLDDTFERILPGRTAIFLAHRLNTIRSCDTVFLMINGQMEAAGQHREMLETNDLYKHLHYLEFNAFAETVSGATP